MTAYNTETQKQLYIPDYDVWDSYYKSTVKRVHNSENAPTSSKESPVVNLKFVSPVAETLDQAASEMRKSEASVKKPFKNTGEWKSRRSTTNIKKSTLTKAQSKSKKLKGDKSGVKKSKSSKTKSKPSFSYRKLDDIFSKRK